MERDAGDLLDRYSICKLKTERAGATGDDLALYRYAYNQLIQTHCRLSCAEWEKLLTGMYEINGLMWDAEAEVRNAQLDHDLEETGRRAIRVRELNATRIKLKNKINELAGEGFVDFKHSHVSAREENP